VMRQGVERIGNSNMVVSLIGSFRRHHERHDRRRSLSRFHQAMLPGGSDAYPSRRRS
jgi:hypothetical protein